MRSRGSRHTRDLALCAIISALAVLVLFLGSVIEVLDLTAAMLASILCVVILIEIGSFWPWLTYAVTATLSLLLLPNKLPAAVFLLTGYYPIIKQKLEKLKKPLAWLLKILIFNIICTVFFLSCTLFFPSVDMMLVSSFGKTLNYVICYAVGNLVFIVYDLALSRLISYYIFVLRDRLRLNKK